MLCKNSLSARPRPVSVAIWLLTDSVRYHSPRPGPTRLSCPAPSHLKALGQARSDNALPWETSI